MSARNRRREMCAFIWSDPKRLNEVNICKEIQGRTPDGPLYWYVHVIGGILRVPVCARHASYLMANAVDEERRIN